MAPLPDEEPFPDEAGDLDAEDAGDAGDGEEEDEHGRRGLLDRMRGMGVGTEDPNIVGDAGPTDVPPGADPPADPIGPIDD